MKAEIVKTAIFQRHLRELRNEEPQATEDHAFLSFLLKGMDAYQLEIDCPHRLVLAFTEAQRKEIEAMARALRMENGAVLVCRLIDAARRDFFAQSNDSDEGLIQ